MTVFPPLFMALDFPILALYKYKKFCVHGCYPSTSPFLQGLYPEYIYFPKINSWFFYQSQQLKANNLVILCSPATLARGYVPNSTPQNLCHNLHCCDWRCLHALPEGGLMGRSTSSSLSMHGRMEPRLKSTDWTSASTFHVFFFYPH